MKKITPSSAFKNEYTLWNNWFLNAKHKLVKRKLFTEENDQAKPKFKIFFITMTFLLLTLGVYALSTDIANFNLFIAIGVFIAVMLFLNEID